MPISNTTNIKITKELNNVLGVNFEALKTLIFRSLYSFCQFFKFYYQKNKYTNTI